MKDCAEGAGDGRPEFGRKVLELIEDPCKVDPPRVDAEAVDC